MQTFDSEIKNDIAKIDDLATLQEIADLTLLRIPVVKERLKTAAMNAIMTAIEHDHLSREDIIDALGLTERMVPAKIPRPLHLTGGMVPAKAPRPLYVSDFGSPYFRGKYPAWLAIADEKDKARYAENAKTTWLAIADEKDKARCAEMINKQADAFALSDE